MTKRGGEEGRLQLKSPQAIFSLTAFFTSTCINYTLAKTWGDQEAAVPRNHPQPSTHPCGIKAKQGEGLREGGVEWLSSGFQVCPGEQEAREPPADHRKKDASSTASRAAPACSSWRPQVLVNAPLCPPFHVLLMARDLCPLPCRAHEVVRGHYPSTALELFCYLSRKELTKPFDLLPKTEKQIKC